MISILIEIRVKTKKKKCFQSQEVHIPEKMDLYLTSNG